jgi:hypothetical protein
VAPVPPLIVLQPKPLPLVQVSALVAPEQEGTGRPLGVVAVVAPSTVLAVWLASAAFGIGEAATASEGVVVELVTVGTSHDGHAVEAAKPVTPHPVHPATRM